jgi:PAT family beta-lactamase induction signal transducer AmpG
MNRETVMAAYFNRRMAALLGIGFAAGLPSAYSALGTTMQAWMNDHDYDVSTVTMFSLVTLPFAFNFVWAPLLDRYMPPVLRRWGRRRGWLIVWQGLIALSLIALALAGPTQPGASLQLFALLACVTAFCVASHDVVADAYRTDVLPDAELGAGAAVYVNGYRIGMVMASAGALMLASVVGWRAVYLILAALMSVGMIATWRAPTPANDDVRPATLADAIIHPVTDFFKRLGWWGAAVLLFVVLFKLPDGLARTVTMPLLQQELKFDLVSIAWVREIFGVVILMAGAFAGGAMLARLGMMRSLWALVALQALSNLGFCALAMIGPSVPALIVVIAVENFCQGMATAGFIAFLMSQCDRRYSATQYALFASLNFLTTAIVGAPTGYVVSAIGYPAFFALTVAAALPAAALLALVQLGGVHRPRNQAV